MKPGDKIKYRNRIGFISYQWSCNRFDVVVGPYYQLYTKVRKFSIHKIKK